MGSFACFVLSAEVESAPLFRQYPERAARWEKSKLAREFSNRARALDACMILKSMDPFAAYFLDPGQSVAGYQSSGIIATFPRRRGETV